MYSRGGFRLGGGRYDFHDSFRGVWGMPPQKNFDFGHLKMAIRCNLGVMIVIYYVFKKGEHCCVDLGKL